MEKHTFDRQVVLLGNPGTKRTIYLGHAAKEVGLHVFFLDWKQWMEGQLEDVAGDFYLKIDPPQWDSCDLGQQQELVESYRQQLMNLALLGRFSGENPEVSAKQSLFSGQGCGQLEFFNHPEDIAALLDKEGCKRKLMEAGLAVTEFLDPEASVHQNHTKIRTSSQLLEVMREKRVFQVFLKPVCGSGAAGVGAFRFQPGTGKMALYTCAMKSSSGLSLVNTKRLRCFREPGQVCALLDQLLASDCVAERWYAKADHQGFAYDLRAVVQEGRMDFLLARLSKGPVTNLHLNNHPLEARELELPDRVLDQVEELCCAAAALYPRLNSIGIDVLLERGSLKPRLIEMNGQGDLIYQDIYHQNRIYRHQAEMMKAWMKRPCKRPCG